MDDLPRIGSTYPDAAFVAAALEGLDAVGKGREDRARTVLQWVWDNGGQVENHPFASKYLGGSRVTVGVAQGVEASLPFGRDVVGLALVELLQDAGNLPGAIAVAEGLDPSQIAAVSLAELYVEAERFDDVVDLTNGVQNVDDPSALLLTFRGLAFRQQGHHSAARESFKEALKSKVRDAGIRHLALLERSRSYQAENKNAMARKDLEKILSEDSSFANVREALNALPD
jgi:tetratricopeptide (TPR) repeat protein